MEQNSFEFLTNLLAKIQIFIARPNVQYQLLIIIIIMIAGWLVSKNIISLFTRFAPPQLELEENEPVESEQKITDRVWLPATRFLVFPILTLIVTSQTITLLLFRGWVTGLLNLLMFILWVLFAYRLFLLLLHIFFVEEDIGRFQSRLFVPLFILFVIYQILNLFLDVTTSAGLVLTNMFENQLTAGSLFIATVGFYLWINTVWGLNQIISSIVTRFTAINEGRLEASLSLVGYILIGLGLAMALSNLGVSSTAFTAIAGGLSVGIGFGLREVLSNFISGILLLFEGAIKPGDHIKVDNKRGVIKKLSVRATLVKMRDNTEVIVPNQKLLTSSVTIFTGEDTILRVDIPVWADYSSNAEEIRNLLMEIVSGCPLIVPEKPPKVFLVNLDESGMEFLVRFWVDLIQRGPRPIQNYIYIRTLQEFDRRGIKVHFPQRELYHHSDWDENLTKKSEPILEKTD